MYPPPSPRDGTVFVLLPESSCAPPRPPQRRSQREFQRNPLAVETCSEPRLSARALQASSVSCASDFRTSSTKWALPSCQSPGSAVMLQ